MIEKNEMQGIRRTPEKREEENPYKYYKLSLNDLIYLIGALLISLLGYLLQTLLTGGFQLNNQTSVIFGIVVLSFLLLILILTQNFKNTIWEKDKKIRDLESTLEVKNTEIRELRGKQSELENTITPIQKKLEKCIEEKKKGLEEIESLRKEKENLSQELKKLNDEISKINKEMDSLKKENARLNDQLQQVESIKRSYEEKVRPYIKASSFMSEERGKILGIFKVDDIYNVSFENKGAAPAFNLKGKVVFYPVIGSPNAFPISVVKLSPGEKIIIPLGGKKVLGSCSKISIDIVYQDILGNRAPLKEEIVYG